MPFENPQTPPPTALNALSARLRADVPSVIPAARPAATPVATLTADEAPMVLPIQPPQPEPVEQVAPAAIVAHVTPLPPVAPEPTSLPTPVEPAQVAAELRRQQSARRMGQALLENGKLTPAQIEEVIETQAQSHLRFGEAAINLGFLSQSDVDEVLASQYDYHFVGDSQGGLERKIHPSLMIAYQPFGQEAEAIRRFRSEILLRLGDLPCIMLAIVSPEHGEGKSHVAASLAVSFAQLHIKTLLIDADLRNSCQHLLFDLGNQSGLSSLLAGRTEGGLAAAVQVLPELRVLCAGPRPPNPSELLSTNRFGDLLAGFAEEVPIIILDTSASSESSDALVVAQLAGRAVMVGRKNQSRLSSLRRIVHGLHGANVQIVGSFYNNPPDPPGWWQRLTGRLSRSP